MSLAKKQKGAVRPQILRATIELTYGCNLRCLHCYNPTHEARGELTTTKMLNILDELASCGCLWVGFTGGELFTRTDTIQILQYSKELGMVNSISTNATMVTPLLADKIKRLDVHLVDISMYGATPDTYEKVTQIRGSFARFVQGVGLLRERGVPILLKLVPMSINIHEYQEMRQFAIDRGIPHKVALDIFPKVDGSTEPLKYRLKPEQVFKIWKEMEEERAGNVSALPEQETCSGNNPDLSETPFDCSCGKWSVSMTPYGGMNLCLSIYYPGYDLTKGSISEGWKELVEIVASARVSPEYECAECELVKLCTRRTKESWLHTRGFSARCISHYREVARMKKDFLAEPEKSKAGGCNAKTELSETLS